MSRGYTGEELLDFMRDCACCPVCRTAFKISKDKKSGTCPECDNPYEIFNGEVVFQHEELDYEDIYEGDKPYCCYICDADTYPMCMGGCPAVQS